MFAGLISESVGEDINALERMETVKTDGLHQPGRSGRLMGRSRAGG